MYGRCIICGVLEDKWNSLDLYLKMLTLGQQVTGVLTTGSVGTVKAPRQPSHSSHNQHQLLYVKLWPSG